MYVVKQNHLQHTLQVGRKTLSGSIFSRSVRLGLRGMQDSCHEFCVPVYWQDKLRVKHDFFVDDDFDSLLRRLHEIRTDARRGLLVPSCVVQERECRVCWVCGDNLWLRKDQGWKDEDILCIRHRRPQKGKMLRMLRKFAAMRSDAEALFRSKFTPD